ncbi:MAG: NAD(P)/FAD-dependent oxidoreductase [Bradymonadia bacterium]
MSGNGPTVDVIVVGAGLSGLAVAREAARAGARVVVFERLEEPVCALEPGWVMAQADADVSDPFFELRAAGRAAMPGFITALESESGVRIERRTTGTLCPALDLPQLEALHARAAWQRRALLPYETLTGGSARDREPGLADQLVAALHLREDQGVDAAALHRALLRAAVEAGAEVHLGAPVLGLVRRQNAIIGVQLLEGHVEAGVTVLAAGWASGLGGLPPVAVEARRQVVCVLDQSRALRHGVFSPSLRLAPRADGRLFVAGPVGAAGHALRATGGEVTALLGQLQSLLPSAGQLPLAQTGAVLRASTPDGRPVLGSDEVVSLVRACGFGEHSVTLAPIVGRLVVEYLQVGAPSIDWSPFEARRFMAESRVN